MRAILKYHISYTAEIDEIEIPSGSKVISAGLDPQGELCIWAIVNPENELELRKFTVVGTGWTMGRELDNWEFIGTVRQGPYMWHVFEVK